MEHDKNTYKSQKGFSILEVVLSLFILSTGLIAVLALTSGSIRHTIDARDALIGAGLAQEGTELVRNVRDNNAAEAFVDDTVSLFRHFSPGSGCVTDYSRVHDFIANTSSNPFSCSGSNILSLDGSGLYAHGGTPPSGFRREIRFSSFDDPTEQQSIDILSVVTWGNEPIPSGAVSASTCNLTNKCLFDETTLTAWILH